MDSRCLYTLVYQTTKAIARSSQLPGDSKSTTVVAVGVAGALFLILITSLIITLLLLLLWYCKRRTYKSEIDPNSGSMTESASYSTSEIEE